MNDCVERLEEPVCGIRCARICFQIAFFIPWTIQKYWFSSQKKKKKLLQKLPGQWERNFSEIIYALKITKEWQWTQNSPNLPVTLRSAAELRDSTRSCVREMRKQLGLAEGLGSLQPPPSRGIRIVEQTQRNILVVLLHRSGFNQNLTWNT